MRGKGRIKRNRQKAIRITPAYAGKSQICGKQLKYEEDHPRVCGEKSFLHLQFWTICGSPPRMRGKVQGDSALRRLRGITPAYAGKSKFGIVNRGVKKDHPRVCGEKKLVGCPPGLLLGSPPRMRGKVQVTLAPAPLLRITPAYAGKRLKKSHSTVSPVAIVPLFPSVCNRPVVSNGNPAERDAPLFLPAENTVPASPAYNLRFS